jgi:hypothetical protein
VDKVSTIVRKGRGRLIWENGEVAHYETELSELLAPPPPPKSTPWYRIIFSAIPPALVLGVILIALSLIDKQTSVAIPESAIDFSRLIALGWFGLLIPAALVLQFLRARGEHRRAVPVWMAARRRWSGLYYCPSDDVVFTPRFSNAVAPWDMDELLYPATPIVEQAVHDMTRRNGQRLHGLRAAK